MVVWVMMFIVHSLSLPTLPGSLASQLILTPPLAVTVNEGSNLSLPCVTVNGSIPMWSPLTVGDANEFALSILFISRELNGTEFTCQFNNETASVLVTVLGEC